MTRPGAVKGGPLAHGRSHTILQDQVPADDPGRQFPEDAVGVRIGAAGLGQYGGQFGVTQGRQGAGPPGQEEGQDNAGAGDLYAHPGNNEDTGPDDLGHPDDHQVQAGEAAA